MGITPRLPYGISDFLTIRERKMTYVDKTRSIRLLEEMGEYLFFLRPRRFGKSLLVNQMIYYYDVLYKDRFSHIFGGTHIGEHPTSMAGNYLVLDFNFAVINPDPEKVEASFEEYVQNRLYAFAEKYREIIDSEALEKRLHQNPTSAGKLEVLFEFLVRQERHKLFLLIDEYDNFTNTIISMKHSGKATYEKIVHGTGFYRNFFNVLKGGTSGENPKLSRLFVTGVSPVTLDDLTSGFNIGKQVSLRAPLAQATGFTHADVSSLIELYKAPEILDMPSDELMELLEHWYGGYGFSKKEAGGLFNPDMILYFLEHVVLDGEMPDDLVDNNVRIDYGKLHHLVTVDSRLNGNFSRIQQVLSEGFLSAKISPGFPLEELIREQNFISLLYYFGLITTRGAESGLPKLVIPNETIASLMYGFMRSAMEKAGVFQLKFFEMTTSVNQMAYKGNWQSLFRYLGEQIKVQTSVRDFVDGEKVVQCFLLAWLAITDFFRIRSEYETNKGFCDLYMEPFVAKYPDIGYGYLVEIKYLKRGDATDANMEQKVAEKVDEAKTQLAQYRKDPHLEKVGTNITWICPILVFHGWELVALTHYED